MRDGSRPAPDVVSRQIAANHPPAHPTRTFLAFNRPQGHVRSRVPGRPFTNPAMSNAFSLEVIHYLRAPLAAPLFLGDGALVIRRGTSVVGGHGQVARTLTDPGNQSITVVEQFLFGDRHVIYGRAASIVMMVSYKPTTTIVSGSPDGSASGGCSMHQS